MNDNFDYKEFVEKCYEHNKNRKIYNASEDHALLLFQKLFDKAIRNKQDIKIISNKLSARFYNQLTNKIKPVLKNKNTVEVIVESSIDDESNNNFYQQIKKHAKVASNFDGLPNFIVVGNSAFRYETDKNSTKAVANFNDDDMGSFLSSLFDKINKDIVPIQ